MKKHRFAKKLAAILAFVLLLGGIAPAGSAKAASLYYGYTSAYGKCARTAYNAGLKKLLGSRTYAGIYLRNLTGETVYTIPEGNYGSQRLWVNTPYSDVENHGTFAIIKIMNVKNTTWHEYAKGNNFAVSDKKAGMVVEKGASVNKLYFQANNGTVNLQVNGEVKKAGFYGDNMAADVKLTGKTSELKLASEGSEIKVETATDAEVGIVKIEKDAKIDLAANSDVKEIVLNSPATLKIEGDAEKIAVTVTEKAEGAKVETSVPVETSVGAKVDLTLNKGAEGSTITKTDEKVDVAVKNDTEEKVEIGTEGSDKKETVEAGKEVGTDDGKTDGGKTDDTSGGNGGGGGGYVPDPGPVKTQLTSVSITPASVTASVAVGNVLTAEAAPAGATVSYQWFRGGTPISGATDAAYTVTADDKGYALSVTATGTGNYTGTVTSAVTATVPYEAEKVVITAENNIAAVVSGGSVVLKAEVLPALATEKTVAWSVTTGSGFDGTADLSAAAGESTTVTITGSKGTVTVKAQAGNVTGTYEITVTDDADKAALANAKAGAKAEINAMLQDRLGSSVTSEYENGYTKESVDALLAVASFAAIEAANSVDAVNTQLTKQKSDVAAALDALVRAYNVTFYDASDKEISIKANPNKRVAAGTKLVVPATEPTKDADALATYEFAGWSENKGAAADDAAVKTSDALSGSAIMADASYYPIFRLVAKTYTITWYDGNGTTELATASAVAGTKASEYAYSGKTPVKAASSTAITYKHTGWKTADGTEDLSSVTVEGDLALYPVFEMEPVTYKELTLTAPSEIHPDDKGNLFANYDIKDGDTDIDLVLPKGGKDGIVEMWITSDSARTQVVSGGVGIKGSGWEFADADTNDENDKELNLGIAKWGGKTLTLEVILTKAAYKITVTPPTAEQCILQAEGASVATPTKVQKRKHAFGEEDSYVTFAVYKDANIAEEEMYPATNTAIAQEDVTSAAVGKLVYLLSEKWTGGENNKESYQMTAWYEVSEKGVISKFSSKIGPAAGDDSGAGSAIELHDIMLNLPVNAAGRTYYVVVQEGDTPVLYKIVIPDTGEPLK